MFKAILFILFTVVTAPLFSQEKYEKWGKIPAEDLKLTVYPHDSSANAVILQERAKIDLKFFSSGGHVTIAIHRRIKIFDITALDQGNLFIPYRSNRKEGEKFRDLDVQMILPNGEKQKVKSDNVFTEKRSKYWSAKKVFIPNLQKGSIIEYRYEMDSEDFITLFDWYFQHELPTRWSELEMEIPQAFVYAYLFRSPQPLAVQNSEQFYEGLAEGGNYAALRKTFALAHLPGLKEDPYMTTLDDYRAHIGFQLNSVNFPGQQEKKYMTNWADLAKELEDFSGFGKQYKQLGNFSKLWDAFSAYVKDTPKAEMPEKALRFVSSNIKWNGDYWMYAVDDLDDAYARKTGNSADLNLAVVALLRTAGIDAVPLLTSTRSNGEMYPEYPFLNQFNTVLAYVRLPEGGIVLDATDPFNSLNDVRTEFLNHQGWIADSEKPAWVLVTAPEISETWYGNLKLAENGLLSGRISLQVTGHLATEWRTELESKTPKEVLKKHFAAQYPDAVLDSVEVTDQRNLQKPLKVDFICAIANTATAVNDYLYCKPVLGFVVEENPFKTLKRQYPVNFPRAFKGQYVLNLELPAGYTLEEAPKGAKIALENNGGKLMFTCNKTADNKVQVILKLNISQLEFNPDEYNSLRKFFDLNTEKVETQLVLKKE